MNVAIIGAGPRGLSLVERLIRLSPEKQPLHIDLIDPNPVGGRVWNPFLKNNTLFLMNTVACQVTLFSDHEPGRSYNLLEWAQGPAADFLTQHPEYPAVYRQQISELKDIRSYSSRGLLGVYAAWYYHYLLSQLGPEQSITYHQEVATSLKPHQENYRINLGNGQVLSAGKVAMALGHQDNQLSAEESQLLSYAQEYQLGYWPAQHPAESNFDQLTGNDTVIARGFGLSFYDYLAALTIGKGGRFEHQDDGAFLYQVSGQEPHIVVGSRSGFPPRTRGVNQKGPSQQVQPVFFTLTKLTELAEGSGGHLSYQDFLALLLKELRYHYLLTLARENQAVDSAKLAQLATSLKNSDDFDVTAEHFGLSLSGLNFQYLANPDSARPAGQTFQSFFRQYLVADIDSARLGGSDSPLTSTFELLRDLRGVFRHLVENDYFDEKSYYRFTREFQPLEARLSVGPPLIRSEQLLALIDAGLVTVLAPGIRIDTQDGQFWAYDREGHHFAADGLIEARLGTINYHFSLNPLVRQLASDGLITESPLKSGAVQVNKNTLQLSDSNLFFYGIPTEGHKYFTTVIPRPQVNTLILGESERIAQQILQ